MKRVTASEARRNWFRILDEVLAGETVVIERRGRRVLIRGEGAIAGSRRRPAPDYGDILVVPELDRADTWGWAWDPERGVVPAPADPPGGRSPAPAAARRADGAGGGKR